MSLVKVSVKHIKLYKGFYEIFNSPNCVALNDNVSTVLENGHCKKKAEFILQYTLKDITYNVPFCNKHVKDFEDYFRNHLKLKVTVYKFERVETFVLS